MSVIDTTTNQVVATIPVGDNPRAVAVTPDSTRAYVANAGSQAGLDTVSVIDTNTNTAIGSPITVGDNPQGIAITPNGLRAYVANTNDDTVSVIDTGTNHISFRCVVRP